MAHTCSIANDSIDPEAADNIAAVISHNTKLQVFNVSENNLKTDGVTKLSKALQNSSLLKQLNISSNNVDSEAVDVDAITAVVSCSSKLQKLYASKINLGTASIIMDYKNFTKYFFSD